VEKGPTREGTIGGRGALLSLVLLLLALVLPVRIALTALGRLVRDKAAGGTCDAGRVLKGLKRAQIPAQNINFENRITQQNSFSSARCPVSI
jgi:hypothetical protein